MNINNKSIHIVYGRRGVRWDWLGVLLGVKL
jgi:hypothetical protein